jgi:hypothetical protein
MGILQELVDSVLSQIPKLALEKRLTDKMTEVDLPVDKEIVSRAAEHILSGVDEPFKCDGNGDDVTIHITNEDLEYVLKATERLHNEQLAGVLETVGDETANLLLKFLSSKDGMKNLRFIQADVEAFKKRLERRWGKPLDKLRILLGIAMEWAQGFYERRLRVSGSRLSHLDDVMLRLHVRGVPSNE